jgi:hypothetical protein
LKRGDPDLQYNVVEHNLNFDEPKSAADLNLEIMISITERPPDGENRNIDLKNSELFSVEFVVVTQDFQNDISERSEPIDYELCTHE